MQRRTIAVSGVYDKPYSCTRTPTMTAVAQPGPAIVSIKPIASAPAAVSSRAKAACARGSSSSSRSHAHHDGRVEHETHQRRPSRISSRICSVVSRRAPLFSPRSNRSTAARRAAVPSSPGGERCATVLPSRVMATVRRTPLPAEAPPGEPSHRLLQLHASVPTGCFDQIDCHRHLGARLVDVFATHASRAFANAFRTTPACQGADVQRTTGP